MSECNPRRPGWLPSQTHDLSDHELRDEGRRPTSHTPVAPKGRSDTRSKLRTATGRPRSRGVSGVGAGFAVASLVPVAVVADAQFGTSIRYGSRQRRWLETDRNKKTNTALELT